jgi:hypothetical protein
MDRFLTHMVDYKLVDLLFDFNDKEAKTENEKTMALLYHRSSPEITKKLLCALNGNLSIVNKILIDIYSDNKKAIRRLYKCLMEI